VESTAPMPAKCPNTAAATAALGSSDVASVTETEMARDINLAQARAAGHTTAMSASILQRADTAIRAEFGSLLPSGRNLRAPGTVTQETPTQFAQTRVPHAATARERIAQAALEERGDFLRGLCITDSSDATLQTVVGGAVLKSRGLSFVRDYQAARIGGQTNYPTVKGKVSPHVTIPSESRNMGHIVVHEAMHYYVNDRYRTTAENDPAREKSLMEGGAEFLARHVINQRLSRLPEFALHTGTYATEFHYVADNLMKAGGIDAFKLAYFQGRIDLLGLPAQPKLAISEPGDALEREADAVADEVLRMDAAETRWFAPSHDAAASSITPGVARRPQLDPATAAAPMLQRAPASDDQTRENRAASTGKAPCPSVELFTELDMSWPIPNSYLRGDRLLKESEWRSQKKAASAGKCVSEGKFAGVKLEWDLGNPRLGKVLGLVDLNKRTETFDVNTYAVYAGNTCCPCLAGSANWSINVEVARGQEKGKTKAPLTGSRTSESCSGQECCVVAKELAISTGASVLDATTKSTGTVKINASTYRPIA
jgi:hypothetical protein